MSTYPSFGRCSKDGTNVRTVKGNVCVACQEKEMAARTKLVLDALERGRAQALREVAREAEKAKRRAAREQRAKERSRQKAAETRARNKAARETAEAEEAKVRAAAAVAPAAAPPLDDEDPWDDGSAPWN
jgi:hypothetical protein